MVGEDWSALMGSRLGREPTESDENILTAACEHFHTVRCQPTLVLFHIRVSEEKETFQYPSICESCLSDTDCIVLGCGLSPANRKLLKNQVAPGCRDPATYGD